MSPTKRVTLHVGAPKTGTSFVQDVLFTHRASLAESGVLYPADRFDAHFLAALDLMELSWGGLEKQAVGAWDRLAEQVRGWDGSVIISHEILATATRQHVRRAVASLGDDVELHVVVSVRDLLRQIPAEWQENVKHRRTLGYRDFLDQITDPVATGPIASWFWGVQDVPAVLGRWAEGLPPEQVHIVTVPRPGAPRHLLWDRFAHVLGLDPEAFDTDSDRTNPSLGVAETEFVRGLNERVNDGVLVNERYRELVREHLAHRTLSRRTDVVPLGLPDDVREWALARGEEWVAALSGHGYDIVGDLEDLRPQPGEESPAYLDPGEVSDHALLAVAQDSVVTLLRRAAELRGEVDDLQGQLAEARTERDAAVAQIGFGHRVRRAVVARESSNRAAGLVLRVYRRLKRRVGSAG